LRQSSSTEHSKTAASTESSGPAAAAGPIGPTRASPASTSESAGPAWSTGLSLSLFWWHRFFLVKLRDCDDKGTFLALARNDVFGVVAAFEGGFEAVQAQTVSLSLIAMTPEARGFKDRTNVFGIGEASLVGGRRELAEVWLYGQE
jgi:hypothetical protein